MKSHHINIITISKQYHIYEQQKWNDCSDALQIKVPGRAILEQGSTHRAAKGPWWREKQEQHKVRNYLVPVDTEVQKGRAKCGEITRLLFGRRQEWEGWQVQSNSLICRKTWDAQMEKSARAMQRQATCPHPVWNLILPCHAISWDWDGWKPLSWGKQY